MKKIYPIIISLILFSFYFPTFFYQFVGDDYFYLYKLETSANRIERIKLMWQSVVLRCYFRPLAWLPYFLGYLLDSKNTAWFHLLSVFLHIANSILVYVIVRFLLGNELIAFFSALFFGLHPINSEVISSAAIFGDISLTFFCLTALISFALFCISNMPKFYIFSLISNICALLSKEPAIMLPLLVILVAVVLYRMKHIQIRGPRIFIPYFLIAIFYLIYRRVNQFNTLTFLAFTPAQILKFVYYIRELVIPLEMSGFKHFVYQNKLMPPSLMISIVILILFSILFLKNCKQPIFLFSLIWVVLTLLIPLVSPFSPVRRHAYLPLVGYSIFSVYFIFYFLKRRFLSILLLSTILILAGAETGKRNSYYGYAGNLVKHSLKKLKEDLPAVDKETLILLVGLPGIVNNTYVFWPSPEDKIKFLYKNRDLSVYCLTVVNFKKDNIPDTIIDYHDDFTFTHNMDTDLERFINPAYVDIEDKDSGKRRYRV